MPTRFHGRTDHESAAHRDSESDVGFGDWWAAIAVIALAVVAIVSLSGSNGAPAREPVQQALPQSPRSDPTPRLLAAIAPAEVSLEAVKQAFKTLCLEPVLLALELEPDCETGVLTLPDHFFDGFGSSSLSREHEEEVAAAMRIYLSRLRRLPALWDRLESIELRGHSDPTALREPYTTNLIGSQQRAIGVLLFLMGSNGLSPEDQADLQELAVVSGVSFSRPPASCPDPTRECYSVWRRVEVRPVLSESLRRGDWSRTLEDVRDTARRVQLELQTELQAKEP